VSHFDSQLRGDQFGAKFFIAGQVKIDFPLDHVCLRLPALAITVLLPAISVLDCSADCARCTALALKLSFLPARQATAEHEQPTHQRSTPAGRDPDWAPWPPPEIRTPNGSG
jgi:hypothetical protein